MKYLLILSILLSSIILSGCSAKFPEVLKTAPEVQKAPEHDRLNKFPHLDGEIITIGVYNFQDKTGQRKPSDNIAQLSSAVTQGADAYLIQALKELGDGTWFKVLERNGLDNVVKERQLIRSTREIYDKNKPGGPKNLKPLLFAGIIIEGGIIGYDANLRAGGVGARYLGIGAQTEYRVDTVTVSMRIVSVSTGEVLLSVATEKSIASYRSGADVFKFLDLGTKAIEAETGFSANEPVNYAVRAAIEEGVIEIVKQGQAKGLWKFKKDNKVKKTSFLDYKPKVLPAPKPVSKHISRVESGDGFKYCDWQDMCYKDTYWPLSRENPLLINEVPESDGGQNQRI